MIGILSVHQAGLGPPAWSRRCLGLYRMWHIDATVSFYIHSGHGTYTSDAVWSGGVRWHTSTIKRRKTTRRNHVSTDWISGSIGMVRRVRIRDRYVYGRLGIIKNNCERPASFHAFADYSKLLFRFYFSPTCLIVTRTSRTIAKRIVYSAYNARITITSVWTINNNHSHNTMYFYVTANTFRVRIEKKNGINQLPTVVMRESV